MRISFHIRCFILSLTLLLVAQGRIHYYKSEFDHKTEQLSKKGKVLDKVDRDGDDQESKVSRKRKPKGVQVAEIQLNSISVNNRSFDYRHKINSLQGPYICYYYKANCKRGPPSA